MFGLIKYLHKISIDIIILDSMRIVQQEHLLIDIKYINSRISQYYRLINMLITMKLTKDKPLNYVLKKGVSHKRAQKDYTYMTIEWSTR